jgi:Tfp pilus assembly protein PilF
MKKHAEAEADLATAIRLAPQNHMHYTFRAAIYTDQGKAAQAQADKLKAEQLQRGQ